MCAIDESSEHNISVWDWQKGEKGQKLAENKVKLAYNLVWECWKNFIEECHVL